MKSFTTALLGVAAIATAAKGIELSVLFEAENQETEMILALA